VIVIVDYGVGNLSSVANMLRKAGAIPKVSRDPAEIQSAEKVVLPGVGHFDHGMRMLRGAGLEGPLNAYVDSGRPLLGICLGAQILGRRSEEGREPGLGWIDMECRRIPEAPGIRVPHMGWNRIAHTRPSALFAQAAPDGRYYFVHSYHMVCASDADVLATAQHGIDFPCAVQRGNV
jgi:glutamine amidotransferase